MIAVSAISMSVTLYLTNSVNTKLLTANEGSRSHSFIYVVIYVVGSLTEPEPKSFLNKKSAGCTYDPFIPLVPIYSTVRSRAYLNQKRNIRPINP